MASVRTRERPWVRVLWGPRFASLIEVPALTLGNRRWLPLQYTALIRGLPQQIYGADQGNWYYKGLERGLLNGLTSKPSPGIRQNPANRHYDQRLDVPKVGRREG